MYAGKHGYAESMKFLTDNLSSNLNEEDKLHNTILMLTVAQDKFHLANKLIKSGAEVNYVNSKGYTALHYCVMRKQKEASSFLLQKGAN
jgi:ankyrin repeat protein